MTRRKLNTSTGGAEMERVNALHQALVEAAFEAIENERSNGEIKPATLNTIRQICSDCGVQPTRQQAEALQSLNFALSSLNLKEVGSSLSV